MTRPAVLVPFLGLPLFVLSACATSGTTRGTLPASGVDVPPEFRGCSSYTRPPNGPYGTDAVTVAFVVGEDGRVEPGSVKPQLEHHDSKDQALVERALGDARSCRFSPAFVDGHPVRVRLTHRFRYDR